MDIVPIQAKQETTYLISKIGSSGRKSSQLEGCSIGAEKLRPVQFTDFPVEIKELIYEQAIYFDQPLSGTIDADFLLSKDGRGKSLLNCLPAICYTNNQERIIASRVFVRSLAFRIWSPECNVNLRHFFDTLPDNVGYGSVTHLRLSCSYAINDPGWFWGYEKPSIDVKLMELCPNLRTLTFACRLYARRPETVGTDIDGLADSFQDVFECKNLSTINLKVFSSRYLRVKEPGLSIFKSLARWLQENFLKRNGIRLVVALDWKIEERWIYTWSNSWDLERPCFTLMEQRFLGSLDESDQCLLNAPSGEAVELLKLSLDQI